MAHLLFIKKGKLTSEYFQECLNGKIKFSEKNIGTLRFLYQHSCFHLNFPTTVLEKDLFPLRKSLEEHQMDVLCIETFLEEKNESIFCFDMDSTVIREEVIDELARKHGVYDDVAQVTKMAMEGGMPFDEALKLRVKNLKGLSRKSFSEVYDLLSLNPGMEDVLADLPSKKTKIIILSGGFNPVLELFSKKYQIYFYKANELEEKDEVFTGEILGEIINKEKKSYYLDKIRTENQILKSQVVAVGDGANDGLMLKTANIGIGFHAKTGLKDQILNWIDFCDMNVLFFLFRPSV